MELLLDGTSYRCNDTESSQKQATDFITHEVDLHKKRDSKEVELTWECKEHSCMFDPMYGEQSPVLISIVLHPIEYRYQYYKMMNLK